MNQSDGDKESLTATARIEAQDVQFVEPLREYLERNGCRVTVNKGEEASILYVIGVGDPEFVKAFFERVYIEEAKKIAIVYESGSDNLEGLTAENVKLYLTDPKPFTEQQTKEIFAFLITSKKKMIDARKDPDLRRAKSAIEYTSSREQVHPANEQIIVDAKRIAKTMQQIFTPDAYIKKKKHKRPGLVVRRGIILSLCVIVLPLVLYIFSLCMGVGLLALSSKALLSGDLYWTQTYIQISKTQIQSAQTILTLGSPVLSFVGLDGYAKDEDRLLSILSDAAQAESGVITIFETSRNVAGAIFFPKDVSTGTSVSDVAALSGEVSRVSQHLALIQAELDSLLTSRRFPFFTVGIQGLGKRGLTALSQVRSLIGYTEKLLTLYPQMGGFRKRQTFLVLLQNSMELRPTGGFIGSMLLLSFADGAVDDMHVLDVYDADGQLKGHIDPPLPIREILGQEHWYLRDSNWDPDFAVSGKTAAWFYEKEMGQSVDGVIAVSLPLVTNMLRVLGPVELPDFNERISENNFYAKSLLYTQTDFFPGSTQKKDFLGALISAMLLRMTGDRALSAGPLLRTVSSSIQSRDIQFYFTNPSLQRLVSQWGWDGGMRLAGCQIVALGFPCVSDGVGIIEANLGINKTNYFVSHEALSDISIAENGTISHTLTVRVHNGTPSQVPLGGGPYQTYFRVYYPFGTAVSSVKLDGVDIHALVDGTPESVIVSVPFTVLPRQEHTLIVETSRTIPNLLVPFSYQFAIRKQAGVSTYPWHVVVRYPPSWEALTDHGIAKPGVLEYNTDLIYDANVRAVFQKQ